MSSNKKYNPASTEEVTKTTSVENAKMSEETKSAENIVSTEPAPVAPAATEPQNTEEKKDGLLKGVVVNCTRLNLRKGPTKENSVVAILPVGSELIVKECDEDDWYKVPGKGYVMKAYIEIK